MTYPRHHTFGVLLLFLLCAATVFAQNVVIVVIDGARYSETLGASGTYMPRLWADLRPQGVLYTSFFNASVTKTLPGHASILTGTWQSIANDGTERPTRPTLFEYYRKQFGAPESSTFVIFGKRKLNVLTHSTDADFGGQHRATEAPVPASTDIGVFHTASDILKRHHPRLVLVSFPEVDHAGHAGDWEAYVAALRRVDSLVYALWTILRADPFYRDSTTMFVTNDHGRHGDGHGGFKEHGDLCEGCRHIMLLALGPGFPPGSTISEPAYQIDLTHTVGEIFTLEMKHSLGRSLLPARPVPERSR